MTTATAPARHNPFLGADCPPWCDVDHLSATPGACVGGGSSGMDRDFLPDGFFTRAIRNRDGFAIAVHASLQDPEAEWPYLPLGLRHAGHLATMVELLADATPAQHRALSAAIRKAAADITG